MLVVIYYKFKFYGEVAEWLSAEGRSASGGMALDLLHNKMACIYILYSRLKNRFYVGSSRNNDARVRLNAHNSRKTRSIKSGVPWIIIREGKYTTYTEARKRELFLKSGVGRAWIKQELGNYKTNMERWPSG